MEPGHEKEGYWRVLDRDPVANMVVVAKPVLAVPHSNRTDLRGNPIPNKLRVRVSPIQARRLPTTLNPSILNLLRSFATVWFPVKKTVASCIDAARKK